MNTPVHNSNPTSSPEHAVELVDVVKKFGHVTAVDHVSLQIQDGEFFSLLGPSGCGKTTTLRMIAGFELPTTGSVYIGGLNQGHLPAYKRPVNTVFQHYALFPHMSVYKNVAFGLEMSHTPSEEVRDRVHEALELVRLEGMERRKPHQLSGGQQQRVALARALINHPQVLLLDEPLGALDLKLRKAMQEELKALQHRVGITFIYVTHDQEEALTMSDRVAVMDRGKVYQIGTPEEIYEQPANRFVADFIGETNFLEGTVTDLGPPVLLRLTDQIQVVAAWAEDGLTVGDPAVLSIRPEKIQLGRSGSSAGDSGQDETCVEGQVHEKIYLGTDTRYIIRLDDQLDLVARIQNISADHRSLELGDRVRARWATTFGRILRE